MSKRSPAGHWFWSVTLCAVILACESSEGAGSESHFLTCTQTSDCSEAGAGYICVSGICRRGAGLVGPESDASGSPRDAAKQEDGRARSSDARADGSRPKSADAGVDTQVIADAGHGGSTGLLDVTAAGGAPSDATISPDAATGDGAKSDARAVFDATLADRTTDSGLLPPPPCDVTEYASPDNAGPYPYNFGITSGPDGNLWATDQYGAIVRITPLGDITRFATPTPNSLPLNIVVGGDGNLWFDESQTNKIGRITPSGVITEFPAVPSSLPYTTPNGIAAGADGSIWFSLGYGGPGELGPVPVARLTVDSDASGSVTFFDSQIIVGGYVALGPDHNIWVVDLQGGCQRFDAAGNAVGFCMGAGFLAAGGDGNMWAALMQPRKILKINGTTGDLIATYSLPPNHFPDMGSIALGPDGNMWFTDRGPSRIGRITPQGVITECSLDPFRLPSGITLGPDGNMWFTENGYGGKIAVLHVANFPGATGGG